MSQAEPTPSDMNLIRSKQVAPLPIGPGGASPIKQQLNNTNVQLTMMAAQATANTKYDPPVPKPITKQITKEGFSDVRYHHAVFIIAGLLIVYGLVAK
jgi:hypothetical protein